MQLSYKQPVKVFSVLVMILLSAIFLFGCAERPAVSKAGELVVDVIDVGQGDAILIRTNGETVLVDSGDVPARDKLVAYIKKQGIQQLDKVIITHPHADHLGGMKAVFDNFPVKQIYDSGQTTTTSLYRQYLTTIKKKKIPFAVITGGDKIELGGGAVLQILSPPKPLLEGKAALNNNSIVAKLIYGNFSMLLTGDAEQEAEAVMVNEFSGQLKSTVLKSGHHGSNTSSSGGFLAKVAPEAAVISAGEGNEYHHPHPSTLKKYQAMKIKIYRTDKDGTVEIRTDGQGYSISKERN